MKVSPSIMQIMPYQPGKPISEAKRELGISHVYKLASNENPWGPSPKAIEALRHEISEVHRYPDPTAFDLLATAAELFGLGRENITIGAGSSELIDLLTRLYCEPGDAILTSKAAFISYKICALSSRVTAIETPLTEDGKFDLARMKDILNSQSHIRLVFIANPNNPTGTYLNEAELTDFLEVCSSKDLLVVLDEAYVEFVRASDFASGLKLREKFPHLIILRTMSKAYGLANLRVGIALGHKDEIAQLNRIRNPFSVCGLSQAAAKAALMDQEYLKSVVQKTWREMDRWEEALKKLQLKYYPSQANFFLADCRRNPEKMFKALLSRGIIARTVTNYDLMSHLRFSVGLPEENKLGIEALGAALSEVPTL
ncbi:MAG: histidinol-phosphate transaminase [Bdellovibrionales bacterium]|nr:histidinol-phosphate transaminase [Bdellovibrionales bacterium]